MNLKRFWDGYGEGEVVPTTSPVVTRASTERCNRCRCIMRMDSVMGQWVTYCRPCALFHLSRVSMHPDRAASPAGAHWTASHARMLGRDECNSTLGTPAWSTWLPPGCRDTWVRNDAALDDSDDSDLDEWLWRYAQPYSYVGLRVVLSNETRTWFQDSFEQPNGLLDFFRGR